MTRICFMCKNEFKSSDKRYSPLDLGKASIVIPLGMTINDRVCQPCYFDEEHKLTKTTDDASLQTFGLNKSQKKFGSFFGFALDSAKGGDTIRVAFQINCKDSIDDIAKMSMSQNILTDIVYPEIQRQIKEGKLEASFIPYKIHILMYSDESRNEILFNDEVRIKGLVKFRDGIKPIPRQEIKGGDLEEILGLYPNEKNDPNAAHIMLVRVNSKWYFACDLIYDRERVRKRFDTAKEFLKVSEFSLKEKLWGSLCDNLFSATELTAQSILLMHHNPFFSTNQDHEKTRDLFTKHAKNGNIDIQFAESHTKLWELRKQGRYLIGVHGRNFSMDKIEAQKLFETTKKMIEVTEKLFERVNFNRKVPSGDYVLFGID